MLTCFTHAPLRTSINPIFILIFQPFKTCLNNTNLKVTLKISKRYSIVLLHPWPAATHFDNPCTAE